MQGLEIALSTWALWGLQFLGLATILLARLPLPHRLGWVAFVGCLLAVGITTFVTFTQGHGGWAPCAMVFGMMTVGAIFESSPSSATAGI